MGKTYRSGHSFPTSAGFTGSSGKVASISPYTRRVPKASKGMSVLSVAPKGAFASTAPPIKGPPKPKPMLAHPKIPAPMGHSLTHRARPVTTKDALHGGTSPLMPGYKKGGRVKC